MPTFVGALLLTASHALAGGSASESPLNLPEMSESAESANAGYGWDWNYEAGEGMTFTNAEGDKSVTFGGRLMYDFAWMSADDGPKMVDPTNPFVDGGEVRRAWLEAKGTLYDKIYFSAQYEFATTNPTIRDLYMGVHDVVGSVDAQFGQFKEPFSLEELTSSKYITFMERGLAVGLAPAWNAGGMLKDNYDCNFGWAAGVFRETDSGGDTPQQKDGAYNFTGRLHWAPVLDDEASNVVHLGLAASMRRPESGEARVRTRPENHLAPYVLDTQNGGADLMTDGISLYGLEAAWVGGPWSAQGEYIMQTIDGTGGSQDVDTTAFYAFVSYFITGEHRAYKASSGTFGRVKPKQNYGQGGNGAWEVAARYSNFDIDAPMAVSPLAGSLDDITLGVNWYMNPNARVMFNYVFGDLDSNTDANDGNMNMFMMRFQVDF